MKRFMYVLCGITLFITGFLRGEVILEETLVNRDTAGFCMKYEPFITGNRKGDFAVVWGDYRNDIEAGDIYLQIYRDGEKQGVNIRVNDDEGTVVQSSPVVSMNDSGDICVVWGEVLHNRKDSSYSEIYCQIFDRDGNRIGGNIFISKFKDVKLISFKVISNGNDFLVLWEEERMDKSYMIYYEVYDREGNIIHDKDSIPSADSMVATDACFIDSVNFVVAGNSYDGNIYGIILDTDGNVIKEKFRINDEPSAGYPSVSSDMNGNFTVIFGKGKNIYGQKYIRYGEKLFSNFVIADVEKMSLSFSISTDENGNSVVVWWDGKLMQDTLNKIYCRKIYSDGSMSSGKELLYESTEFYGTEGVSFGNNVITIAWLEGERDIYGGRKIYRESFRYSDCEAIGEKELVNDDIGSYSQIGYIEKDKDGYIYVVWSDVSGMYYSVFDRDGNLITDNVKIEYGKGDSNGDVNIVIPLRMNWDWSHFYVVGYDRYGNLIKDTVRVDERDSMLIDDYMVSTNSRGDFVVIWRESDYGDLSLYVQRFDSDFKKIGHNILTTDEEGVFCAYRPPFVKLFDDGSFEVCYSEFANLKYYVRVRRYNSSGEPEGSSERVNDNPNADFPYMTGVGDGRFVCVWHQASDEVWGQLFDKDGKRIGNNFRIEGSIVKSIHVLDGFTTSAAMFEDGSYIIGWTEGYEHSYNRNPDIMGQLFRSDGSKDNRYFLRLTDEDESGYHYQYLPLRGLVSPGEDRVAMVFMDNRRHKGYDVYIKIFEKEDVRGIEDMNKRRIRMNVVGNGEIEVEAGDMDRVRIYDVSGRVVREERGRGELMRIKIGSSGIYFIEVSNGKELRVKKVVLLK